VCRNRGSELRHLQHWGKLRHGGACLLLWFCTFVSGVLLQKCLGLGAFRVLDGGLLCALAVCRLKFFGSNILGHEKFCTLSGGPTKRVQNSSVLHAVRGRLTGNSRLAAFIRRAILARFKFIVD
jgi:hypothetical protein